MLLARFSPYFDEPRQFNISDLRPWAVYDMVFPQWREDARFAYYFTGDYDCRSHDHPGIIEKIAHAVQRWQKSWKQSGLVMIPYNREFIIEDRRNFQEKDKTHVLDYPRAAEIMTDDVFRQTENQEWAVEEGLALVVDSRYVPLVTAQADLLRIFKDEYNSKVEERALCSNAQD